jgi:hypothetical protein
MIIDITREVNLFLSFLGLGIGLDFIWCGYWYMKTNELTHLPRLLGYLAFKIFETGNKKNKSKNTFATNMFSMEAATIYMLLSGIYLIVRCTFSIVSYFYK